MRTVAKIVLPILIVAVAIGGFVYLRATRPQATPAPVQEKVWPVAAVTARITDEQPRITEFGTIVAGSVVELRPLVAGRIVELGPNFVEGAIARAGQTVVVIDPFNYKVEVDDKRAALAESRARLKETEAEIRNEWRMLDIARAQVALRDKDLKRKRELSSRGTLSRKAYDDALIAFNDAKQSVEARNQVVARMNARAEQQRASVLRAQAALRRAERDLSETVLIVPKDGFLTDVVGAVGQRVSTNDRVARLIVSDRLEVSFQLSQRDFGHLAGADRAAPTRALIGKNVKVGWRVGEERFSYEAVIERLSAKIDSASGGIGVYARMVAPDLQSPLRPGAFVEVSIPDATYRRVLRLPESAIMDGDKIYVVRDGRLVGHDVEVLRRDAQGVLVRADVPAESPIVTTRFPEIGPGVRVEVR